MTLFRNQKFTSEAVSKGHPDKIADQISDAILDFCLRADPDSRVAVETLVKDQYVILAGEVTTTANLNAHTAREIVADVIHSIGYTDSAEIFSCHDFELDYKIGDQSKDISRGVDIEDSHIIGAGDQGIMYGYACNETSQALPLAYVLATRLMLRQQELVALETHPILCPDAKAQVTLEYDEHGKARADTILISTQHIHAIIPSFVHSYVMEQIIRPVFDSSGLVDDKTRILINPTGRFVIGGPVGDCGLTGRKIVADSYGGAARHGGGAYSGKDYTKVDRSASYMARRIAKAIVHAGFATHCEIQLAYSIGRAAPLSLNVNTFGTLKPALTNAQLEETIKEIYDCTPKGIETLLDLKNIKYSKTAQNGHYGQKPVADCFTWEHVSSDAAKFHEKLGEYLEP